MKTYKNCVYKLYFEGEESKCYIGGAKNFSYRYRSHLMQLLINEHPNKLLQFAFNKHGLLALKWEILEENIGRNLLARESYYISLHNSCMVGFNQAFSTGNKNELYISQELNKNNGKDIIKLFINQISVNIKPIYISNNERYKKFHEVPYTRYWWGKIQLEDLFNISISIYNYIQNVNKSKFMDTMILCDEKQKMESLKNNYITNSTIEGVVASCRKFYNNTKKKIKDIILMSALNPLHVDIPSMSEQELYEYRLGKCFKLLSSFNLEKDITVHVPMKYYEGFKKVLEDINHEGLPEV